MPSQLGTAQGQTTACAAGTSATMMPAPATSGYASSEATSSMYMPLGGMIVPMVMVPVIVPVAGVGGGGAMTTPMEFRQPDRGVRWSANAHQASDISVASGSRTAASESAMHGQMAVDQCTVGATHQ